MNAALRRMGFDKDEMTSHGFRSMAATRLNEMGRWTVDAIERQLAHQDPQYAVGKGVYARGGVLGASVSR